MAKGWLLVRVFCSLPTNLACLFACPDGKACFSLETKVNLSDRNENILSIVNTLFRDTSIMELFLYNDLETHLEALDEDMPVERKAPS